MVLQVKCAEMYRECSFFDQKNLWTDEKFQDLLAHSARIRATTITPTNNEKVLYVYEGSIVSHSLTYSIFHSLTPHSINQDPIPLLIQFFIHSLTHSLNQGEIAQNVSEETYDYVATDDATTCHILVAIYQLKNENSKRISVCHIASVENSLCLIDYLDQIAVNCKGNIINIYLVCYSSSPHSFIHSLVFLFSGWWIKWLQDC